SGRHFNPFAKRPGPYQKIRAARKGRAISLPRRSCPNRPDEPGRATWTSRVSRAARRSAWSRRRPSRAQRRRSNRERRRWSAYRGLAASSFGPRTRRNSPNGIAPVPEGYGGTVWHTEAGTTVFAPFAQDTTYFGDPRLQWMINFRVRDLDKMAAQLRAGGIQVDIDPQTYPNGRFARLADPEGNPIQLWQPTG